jgi:hypothetical protein
MDSATIFDTKKTEISIIYNAASRDQRPIVRPLPKQPEGVYKLKSEQRQLHISQGDTKEGKRGGR